MSSTASQIFLLDCAQGEKVPALFYDKIKENHLSDANLKWKKFLGDAAQTQAISKASEESAHWNWDKKVKGIEGELIYESFAIECENETQGLMILNNAGKACKLESQKNKPIVYVEYLETAPWNRPTLGTPKYKGVGRIMIAAAIQASVEAGFKGRIGLHSLPQSETYYLQKCGMHDLGNDKSYASQLRYLEMTPEQAELFLRS